MPWVLLIDDGLFGCLLVWWVTCLPFALRDLGGFFWAKWFEGMFVVCVWIYAFDCVDLTFIRF